MGRPLIGELGRTSLFEADDARVPMDRDDDVNATATGLCEESEGTSLADNVIRSSS